MAIAHRSTLVFRKRSNSSRGWLVGYAVLAAAVIAAFIYLAVVGQGVAELDPSQLVGP